MVDDLGRFGAQLEKPLEDLGVQPAPHRRRNRGMDGGAGELVPEADVARSHVEQVTPLRVRGGIRPVGEDPVEERRRHTSRHDRDQLDEPPRRLVEPRRASHDLVRNRGGHLVGVSCREQLGDVERVAARRGEDVGPVFACEDGDRVDGERREVDERRVDGGDVSEQRIQRMLRRDLAGPQREDQHRVQ